MRGGSTFNLVLDCLPLLVHASLLLLCGGLSTYLFFIDQTVAGVVTGFTSFCFLSTSPALPPPQSPNSHFQIPLSLTLRYLARSLVPKTWLVDNPRRKPRPSRSKTKCKDRVVPPTRTPATDPTLPSAAERSTGMVMRCTPNVSPGCSKSQLNTIRPWLTSDGSLKSFGTVA